MSQPIQLSQALNAKADAILKTKTKIDWRPIDIDCLPPDARKAYDAYREAQKLANELREGFEDIICGPVAKLLGAKPGQDVTFTYRFGLAAGLTDKTQSKPNALRLT